MPFYQRQGDIPRKRHITHRKQDGSLHCEELISREGFSGSYSNLYHLGMPTRVKRVGDFQTFTVGVATEPESGVHRPRHLRTFQVSSKGDLISARRLLFFNRDVLIHKVHPTEDQHYFYRNGHFDELLYVQRGTGELRTQFGVLVFGPGDYLVIPRGIIYQMAFVSQASLLLLESPSPIQTPKRYRNSFGQLLEHSPYCERDIRVPKLQMPSGELGEYRVVSRLEKGYQEYIYDRHPFDVVGWDGCHFPWAFNIHDFEPIVGRIHQPPSVHQTFESAGFVVCSFVSRPFDFHPEAIPAPYPHSNVDSDEVLFYSAGEFMSRSGIYPESMTYHPMGLPHGPQPGRYEGSIGKKFTEELAVMIDTFRPLNLAKDALSVDDPQYALSWMGA